MKVLKIGGILFQSSSIIPKIEEVLGTKEQKVIIISAFGKSSSKLKEAAFLAANSNLEESFQIISNVEEYFIGLFENQKELIENEFADVKALLKSVNKIKECSNKTLDKILSYGDKISARVISEHFAEKNAAYIDPEEFIICKGEYGRAEILIDESRSAFDKISLDHNLTFIAGFVGKNTSGKTVTMGFESSNLSAVAIALFLGVNQLEVISNVDGVKTIDPELMTSFKHLEGLSMHDAKIASQFGLKIFNPSMIELARENHIDLIYRSLDSSKKTIISNDVNSSSYLIILSDKIHILNAKIDLIPKIIEYFEIIDIHYQKPDHILSIRNDDKIDLDLLIGLLEN